MFLRPMNVNFGATISPRFIMEDRTSSHIAGGKIDFFPNEKCICTRSTLFLSRCHDPVRMTLIHRKSSDCIFCFFLYKANPWLFGHLMNMDSTVKIHTFMRHWSDLKTKISTCVYLMQISFFYLSQNPAKVPFMERLGLCYHPREVIVFVLIKFSYQAHTQC